MTRAGGQEVEGGRETFAIVLCNSSTAAGTRRGLTWPSCGQLSSARRALPVLPRWITI